MRFGTPQEQAHWLRRLAAFVEKADGHVSVHVITLHLETLDVSTVGAALPEHMHTGRWTCTLEIEGSGGFGPPGQGEPQPPMLEGR